ncbi:LacI family transcriptional regulator [Amycolatopsis sp. MJM2582]|uniref:LacI family DNA-binding transcriptional regulator n=1 Tax=Amycolatopsis TaxID=1813 RepID=UPI000507B1CF|nr:MULTISPECIES: LacI family DNA-binding transcriptional regulator [unclassified Amycolatopsis]KFZ80988.1 LacI family transcriptional regulator [Amycolatopsis sp. MJM2582]RSN40223.1 LacI family transcriptional regulator [Amycolatopsis sp. WAC 04197]
MAQRAAGSATLADVAREAGVSLATASRALNGGTRQVSGTLRESVLRAAERLQYTANVPAQAMARGRGNVVGLLVHDIVDPYFSSIASGVMRVAARHGLTVTIASTENHPEKELEYVTTLRGQRARAVILAGSRNEDSALQRNLTKELKAFEAADGQVVVIGQRKLPFDTVMLENRAGAADLAERLALLGHRDFLVLAGPSGLLTSRDRVLGFRDGLARQGVPLPENHVLRAEFTRDGGYAAMVRAIENGFRGCVFAVNDVMAVGAMAACRDRGLQVPAQIAIAGFDDIITLRDIRPSLSTVRVPIERMGEQALDFILDHRADGPRVKPITGEVVLRESTQPLEGK